MSQEPRAPLVRLAALAAAVFFACDVPTGTPDWEQTWVVPGDSTSMSVADLLPASVTLTQDRSAFLLSLEGVTFRQSLGDMCSLCGALHGRRVPKPAFSFSFQDQVELPGDVASASLAGGVIDVELSHDFGFDPIRPSATARGSLTARLVHGGATLASVTISGESTAFPSGTVLPRSLALPATVLTGPIAVEISITSPEGDSVVVDVTDVLSVTAVPRDIRVSEARVRVVDRTVDVEAVEVDLEDVESTVANRVRSGAFLLEIQNPFDVSGTLSLRVTAPGANIVKSLSVSPGASTRRLEFTGSELRSILGKRATMSASGGVSATGGAVTVRPTQILVVKSKIELVIGLKEEG